MTFRHLFATLNLTVSHVRMSSSSHVPQNLHLIFLSCDCFFRHHKWKNRERKRLRKSPSITFTCLKKWPNFFWNIRALSPMGGLAHTRKKKIFWECRALDYPLSIQICLYKNLSIFYRRSVSTTLASICFLSQPACAGWKPSTK